MLLYLFFPLALILSSSLGIFMSPVLSVAHFVWVLMIVPIIDIIMPKFNKEDTKLFEKVPSEELAKHAQAEGASSNKST